MSSAGILVLDLVAEVIRPALVELARSHPPPGLKQAARVIPHSVAAEQLLALTALVESGGGRHLRQRARGGGFGPALGVFQMEPRTHDDIVGNYLEHRKELSRAGKAAGRVRHYYSPQLTYNLRYAATMTRIHYYRAPKKLPKAGDALALAEYWKRFYNTPKGAGTVEKALAVAQTMLRSNDARALEWM